MTVEEIRELIGLVSDSGIAELEVQRGDNRVRIRRSVEAQGYPPQAFAPQAYAPVMYHTAGPHQPQPPSGPSPQALSPQQAPEAPKPEATQDPAVKLVKSPIVGTFYECPSPGSPAFVRIGETVQPGRVLCIIESMKLMNEIEAEFAGVIESRLVPNGQPVEYGEALFAIRAI
jgi:acetyl-CoA carboxylase biotin carboxyl carrier protein